MPTAKTKKFRSSKNTASAHRAHQTLFKQAQNSNCLKHKISITTKTDSAHHACVTKQSQLLFSNNNCTSSKFHLLQARISQHERKHTVDSMCAYQNNLQSDFQGNLHKLKITPAPPKNFASLKKTDSAHYACFTLFEQALYCNSLKEIPIMKENRLCTTCMRNKAILNLNFQE